MEKTKTGRNEPCPCGSGKKFKKCCRDKAYQQQQDSAEQFREVPSELPRRISEPIVRGDWDLEDVSDDGDDEDELEDVSDDGDNVDDKEERDLTWWFEFEERFHNAPPGGKLAVVLEAIDSAPEFDGEDVFSTAEKVYLSLSEEERHGEILQVFDAIEKRWPEAFEEEQGWVGFWRVRLALKGLAGTLEEAVGKLAPGVEQVSDLFYSDIMEPLAWRGRGDLLALLWRPLIEELLRQGASLLPGVAELAIDTATSFVLAGAVARDRDCRTTPELLQELSSLHFDNVSAIEKSLDFRTGRKRPLWGPEFDNENFDVQEQENHLLGLALNLSRRLGEAGWSTERAELANLVWTEFLVMRLRKQGGYSGLLPLPRRMRLVLPSINDIVAFVSDSIAGRLYHGPAVFCESLPHWLEMTREFRCHLPVAMPDTGSLLAQKLASLLADFEGPPELAQALERGCAALQKTVASRGPVARIPDPFEAIKDPDVLALTCTGKKIPSTLWHRIVERGSDVLGPLHDFLAMSDVLMFLDGEGDERADVALWGFTHAFFLLATMGDPSSVPYLLKLAAGHNDNEWMAEGLAWVPTAFAPGPFGRFLQFTFDESIRRYPRANCAKGIVWAAGLYPELRPRVTDALAKALNSDLHDGEMATWLARPAVRTGHPDVLAALENCYARDAIEEGAVGDLDDLLKGEPRDWYLTESPPHVSAADYRSRATKSSGPARPKRPPSAKVQKRKRKALKNKKKR
jgi:hypothetical protein